MYFLRKTLGKLREKAYTRRIIRTKKENPYDSYVAIQHACTCNIYFKRIRSLLSIIDSHDHKVIRHMDTNFW